MFHYTLIDHPDDLDISTEAIDTIMWELERSVPKEQKGTISIVCTSAEAIQKWNHTYRGKDSPTDILTFPYYENFAQCQEDEIVWEILICLEHVKKKNIQSGTNVSEWEVNMKNAYYEILIHGLVHMLGYDHETDEEWNQMQEIEKKVQKNSVL